MSRTKLGKDIIFVGDKSLTIKRIISLCKTRNQWTDYMESILDLVTIEASSNGENQNSIRQISLTTESYPFRICDIPLPRCKSGFVYFLISVRTCSFTYIGECKCIVNRLANHNSGHGSSSTIPSHQRPYAILGYIGGFNGTDKTFRRFIERRWKEKRDELIREGINDPREWFRSGSYVISSLDDRLYSKEKRELRMIELFRT